MIAVVFIGLARYTQTTNQNHEKVLGILDKKFGIKRYNFYRNEPIVGCPFIRTGTIQVYDFIESLEKVTEDIVVKFRSDIYFTDTSIDVLVSEIEKIIKKENDLAYIGLDFNDSYDQKYARFDARKVDKVTDFVIIAKKSLIPNKSYIIQFLHDCEKNPVVSSSGNYTYFVLINEKTKAAKISTQLYLVRKEYESCENWQIYYDWCSQYKIKSPFAYEWVENNKKIINKF
jgi:hypothetical protein